MAPHFEWPPPSLKVHSSKCTWTWKTAPLRLPSSVQGSPCAPVLIRGRGKSQTLNSSALPDGHVVLQFRLQPLQAGSRRGRTPPGRFVVNARKGSPDTQGIRRECLLHFSTGYQVGLVPSSCTNVAIISSLSMSSVSLPEPLETSDDTLNHS